MNEEFFLAELWPLLQQICEVDPPFFFLRIRMLLIGEAMSTIVLTYDVTFMILNLVLICYLATMAEKRRKINRRFIGRRRRVGRWWIRRGRGNEIDLGEGHFDRGTRIESDAIARGILISVLVEDGDG